MAEQTPDSIITTQKNGPDHRCGIVFQSQRHRNIPRQAAQSDTCRQLAGRSRAGKIGNFCDNSRPDDTFPVRAVFIVKNAVFSKSRAGENTRKMPLLRNRGAERRVYANRASQAKKDHRHLV